MSPPGARQKMVSFGAEKCKKVPKSDIGLAQHFLGVSLGIIEHRPPKVLESKWQVWQVF